MPRTSKEANKIYKDKYELQFPERRKLYREKNKIKIREKEWKKRGIDITYNEYLIMLEAQCECCAICARKQEILRQSLCVDHDHQTGKIRGLLCHDCNIGIGRLKDSIELVKKALEYLNKSQ